MMSGQRNIAIMNQQPGVGKTTVCLNIGRAMAALNQSCLLIDLCPDASLSKQLGLDLEPGIAELMMNTEQSSAITINSQLSLMPAGQTLDQLAALQGRDNGLKLRKALQQISADSSVVLIDCPSEACMLNANALLAADEILIPITPVLNAWQGMVQMVPVLRRLRSMKRPPLIWLMLNAIPDEPKIAEAYCGMLGQYFHASLLKTVIYDFSQHKPETQTERFKTLAADVLYGRTR